MKLTVADRNFEDNLKSKMKIQKFIKNIHFLYTEIVSGQNKCKPSNGRHNLLCVLIDRNSIFEMKISHTGIYSAVFWPIIYFYVTTIPFLTLAVYYKLQDS